MNNSSIRTADRLTHLKIVVVSLVAGIAVVGVGIAARPTMPDMSTQLEARAPVLKPGSRSSGPARRPRRSADRRFRLSPSTFARPSGARFFWARAKANMPGEAAEHILK